MNLNLTFRLGRLPVVIEPWFFLTALLLGGSRTNDLRQLLPWILVVFVSVLLHELGHATAGRLFGLQPIVRIHGMGGTTHWLEQADISHKQSFIISVAGPLTGLLVGTIAIFASRYLSGGGSFVDAMRSPGPNALFIERVVSDLVFVNIAWSIFNLFPIMPMDGGNALRSLLNWVTGREQAGKVAWISIVLAGLLALLGLLAGSIFNALLAGTFVFHNIQILRALREKPDVDGR